MVADSRSTRRTRIQPSRIQKAPIRNRLPATAVASKARRSAETSRSASASDAIRTSLARAPRPSVNGSAQRTARPCSGSSTMAEARGRLGSGPRQRVGPGQLRAQEAAMHADGGGQLLGDLLVVGAGPPQRRGGGASQLDGAVPHLGLDGSLRDAEPESRGDEQRRGQHRGEQRNQLEPQGQCGSNRTPELRLPRAGQAPGGGGSFSCCFSSSPSPDTPFLNPRIASPRLAPSCGSLDGPKKRSASARTTMISPKPSLIEASGEDVYTKTRLPATDSGRMRQKRAPRPDSSNLGACPSCCSPSP